MSLEEAVATANAERAEERAAGNPYDSPGSDEWKSVRHTGSPNYGELGFAKEYRAHYEMRDEEQKTSTYTKQVDELIAQLEAERATLFAGAALTGDFRIHRIEHGY